MNIDQIKEWRKAIEPYYYIEKPELNVIDTLLAEVGRLEKQCAQYKDIGGRMIDGLFDLSAKLTAAEQKLAVATKALHPFTEAAKEVTLMGCIKPVDHWLWKPARVTRECAGVNAQMLFDAADALKQMEVGNESETLCERSG